MPILPFPAHNPRLPDMLVAEFFGKLKEWGVRQPDLAYAAEDDPLDLYRQLVRLYDLRERVFAPGRPSQVVLSPLGSKLLAVGAMMAAIERDMPVLYVEAPDFRASPKAMDSRAYTRDDIVHLWLAGEAYPAREYQPSDRHPSIMARIATDQPIALGTGLLAMDVICRGPPPLRQAAPAATSWPSSAGWAGPRCLSRASTVTPPPRSFAQTSSASA
ncbi:MAG: hypothetical protein IPI35_27200 [Deltaproteobacteria bacterium]|nr:hypothetical protein [Deltaproteobacteria bacterium]